MKWLDLTLPTPAENLACDEALLDRCDEGQEDEILRFWEPAAGFVVTGYANHVSTEVNLPACDAGKIPILRRCSGGGTVLQGPGCLNYALILKIADDGPLRNLAAANRFIMEHHRAALEELLREKRRYRPLPPSQYPVANRQSPIANENAHVEIQGHTDLTVAGLKFSGNAQRRKRRALLFHGTFLLQFDFRSMEQFLPLPSKQPAYRQHRRHGEFLINLALPPDSVKQCLRRAWRASAPFPPADLPRETITSLARDKYETSAWNMKFK